MSPTPTETTAKPFENLATGPETTFTSDAGFGHDARAVYEKMRAAEEAQVMAEIDANEPEREQLRRARQQIREGAGRWLGDDENPSDAID